MLEKKTEANEMLRKMKGGKVQKHVASEIPIEKKSYKVSQLNALEGRFKKISTPLSLDEEKNEGRSIMINMKTTTFEVLKRRLLGLLQKHPSVNSASLVRTAKASTDEDDADVEYHIDVDMIVESIEHKLKMKIFNTNCRIQVQQIGKDTTLKEHLGFQAPPRYFSENIILPLCKAIEDSIPAQQEKDIVVHLKEEIMRLKKFNKGVPKPNKKGKCVNMECSSKGNLDINNIEKYGTCQNCNKQEHFRCASVDPVTKSSYQNGTLSYLCSLCLTNNPELALQTTQAVLPITLDESVDMQSVSMISTKGSTYFQPASKNDEDVQERDSPKVDVKCDECTLSVANEKQLKIHKRLKHEEIIKFTCEKCPYSCATEKHLSDHIFSNHEESQEFKCEKCDFKTSNQSELFPHGLANHTEIEMKCVECSFTTKIKEEFDNHLKIHTFDNIKCDKCDFYTNKEDELRKHITSTHSPPVSSDESKRYEELLAEHMQLKQNYERLINIQKKLNEQMKDKEYALKVQMEELRSAYEVEKTENIKLKDNVDTQNKLWKVWLESFDKRNETNTDNTESNPVVTDTEQSVPDTIIAENVSTEETEEDVTDIIFNKYMENMKNSGFKRTSPTTESISMKTTVQNVGQSQVSIQQKKKRYCHYWSNFGSCQFAANNGRPCKFLHEVAPTCNFDGSCERKMCMYTHRRQNVAFLAQPSLRAQLQPQTNQMRNQSHQMNPWQSSRDSSRLNSHRY